MSEISPEQVAYRLAIDVARAERKFDSSTQHFTNVDREWLLDTYSECLSAVRGTRGAKQPKTTATHLSP